MTANPLDLKTPAQGRARELASDYGLANHGITNPRCVYWNLPAEALYEEVVFRGEGRIVRGGAVAVDTGSHTSRAAQDKFIVREPSSEDRIWWGEYNRPIGSDTFELLLARMLGFLQERDLFVQDVHACAQPEYRLPLRVVSEYAWHSLFARNMFLKPESREAYRRHVPELTILCAPSFEAHPPIDGTRTGSFIALDFARKLCLIGGTQYAGELKKSVFTVLNYLLPLDGVLSMHCSANVDDDGSSALFFGLSGTGKTTLSADPRRGLVGDDEHGWSDEGIFNHEDGCYAKAIRLSASAEPQIHSTTHRFGTVLENVVFDEVTRRIDLDDDSLTENTRASYPLDFIEHAVPSRTAGHPSYVLLLTCDAQGVLPPLARLTTDQALYHFVSGYTSKIAGTEAGLGAEPEIVFSTCFGAPFMVHHPWVYADLLARKLERHGSSCWLVNTGWVGGPFGVGKRISIEHTRTLLDGVLSGALAHVEHRIDPVFGFEVPTSCPGLPDEVLHPEHSWPSEDEYMARYRELAARYAGNFRKLGDECPPGLLAAGPRLEREPVD
ncbi:MAG TPA: phosphoenolpyruvate carboxykinase (ATP) [Gaiellaceae bacterium]|nr:phosphoenolpyruvate carboxykinase (ATP) [Gaiellaceae bacterium]